MIYKLFMRLKCILTNHRYTGDTIVKRDENNDCVYEWICARCGKKEIWNARINRFYQKNDK